MDVLPVHWYTGRQEIAVRIANNSKLFTRNLKHIQIDEIVGYISYLGVLSKKSILIAYFDHEQCVCILRFQFLYLHTTLNYGKLNQ